jgi:ABC-type branched-subunit amino acid transport system substrate-binding protein
MIFGKTIGLGQHSAISFVFAVAVALCPIPVLAQDPIKLGVLSDMSSLYADNGGHGSVVAAQMAVDDFGGEVLGRKVEIVVADHQNKADIGSAIVRRWLDHENVEAIWLLSSAFYWDLNDDTRAWAKRFIEKTQKVPTMIHAGTYGAVMHYLKAVGSAGTLDGPIVAAKMREMPVNDFMTRDGKIREDGRLVRDMYLFRVKSPEESKYKFDYYKLLATIPGNEAFRPMEEGGCPLLKK